MAEVVFLGTLRDAVEADEGPRCHSHDAEYSFPPVCSLWEARSEIRPVCSSKDKEGYKADILVIDFEHFSACERLYDPRCGINGLDYVIVGGQVAVCKGEHTHVRSGCIL